MPSFMLQDQQSPKNRIQVVLLDLGGVVFQLDWEPLFHALGSGRGEAPKSPALLSQFLSDWPPHDLYERGKLSTEEFFAALKDHFKAESSLDEIQEAWNKIVSVPLPGIEDLLARLSQTTSLWALSNTNECHYLSIRAKYPFLNCFKKIFTSFELGFRKPEIAIYSETLKQLRSKVVFDLTPSDILFVDDNVKNLEAARGLGIQAEFCLNSVLQLNEILSRNLPKKTDLS